LNWLFSPSQVKLSCILKGYVTCTYMLNGDQNDYNIYSNLGLKRCWYFKSSNTGSQFSRQKFKISEYSIWISTPSPTVYCNYSQVKLYIPKCIMTTWRSTHFKNKIFMITIKTTQIPPPSPPKKEIFRQWSVVTKYATQLFKVWGWISYYTLHLFHGYLTKI